MDRVGTISVSPHFSYVRWQRLAHPPLYLGELSFDLSQLRAVEDRDIEVAVFDTAAVLRRRYHVTWSDDSLPAFSNPLFPRSFQSSETHVDQILPILSFVVDERSDFKAVLPGELERKEDEEQAAVVGRIIALEGHEFCCLEFH